MLPHKAKLGKVARFGLVGVFSTLLYVAATNMLVTIGSMHPAVASGLGYLIVIPLNYLLHRSFSFRSTRSHRSASHRYLLVHLLNIAGSMGVMQLVTSVLHLDYRVGIVLTATMVPVIVFVVLDRWVFPDAHASSRDDTVS